MKTRNSKQRRTTSEHEIPLFSEHAGPKNGEIFRTGKTHHPCSASSMVSHPGSRLYISSNVLNTNFLLNSDISTGTLETTAHALPEGLLILDTRPPASYPHTSLAAALGF